MVRLKRGLALLTGASAAALLGVAAGPGASPASAALPDECVAQPETETVQCTFLYTGSTQTFTVPDGVYSIDIFAVGAVGGDGGGVIEDFDGSTNAGVGGPAGVAETQGYLVTPGANLYVEVGGVGGDGAAPQSGGVGGAGGYNGGGSGGSADDLHGGIGGGGGGGGGGATDVRSGADLATRIIVASGGGGGGGGGRSSDPLSGRGGDGGGPSNSGDGAKPGRGASEVGGGLGELPGFADGSWGQGGDAEGFEVLGLGAGSGGGGGGGGLYGGGGGMRGYDSQDGASGGGGGSSTTEDGVMPSAAPGVPAQVVIEFADPSVADPTFVALTTSVPGGRPGMAMLTVPPSVTDAEWLLSASSDIVDLPVSVTIPAGATSATIEFTTSLVTETIPVTLSASDGAQTLSTTIEVFQDTLVTTPSLPDAVVGEEYSVTFEAVGGAWPEYFWSTPPDAVLPPGLTLTSAGEFSGVPTQAGTYTFMVVASNGTGNNRVFTLNVLDPSELAADDDVPPSGAADPDDTVDPVAEPAPLAGDAPEPVAGELAATGADPVPTALLGGGLLLGGAALLALGRRRA